MDKTDFRPPLETPTMIRLVVSRLGENLAKFEIANLTC